MIVSEFARRVLLPLIEFAVAFSVSSLAVVLLLRLRVSRRLTDYPDSGRHSHGRPVPRLGGVAIFAGFIAALGVGVIGNDSLAAAVDWPQRAGTLALAAAVLFVLGLLDDMRGVRPFMKLAGQTAAALIVYYGGFRIDVLSAPPDAVFSLHWLSLPITVVWLVGVSNALNLVDGLDGLAGGVSVIALISTSVAAVVLRHGSLELPTIALLGALCAFLRFNVPPARIFLGDSGSLVVGFLLAVLTVKGATRVDGTVFLLAPIFALSYPLLDTGISMLRRWLRGDPLSRADGRHIHHQLLVLGVKPPRATALVCAGSLLVAGMGLCVALAPPAVTVAVTAFGIAILLFVFVYGARVLQYHEFLEAGASFASAARQARRVIRDKINAREIAQRIVTATSFDDVVDLVEDSARTFRFARMTLRAAIRPRASATSSQLPDTSDHWRLEYPVAPRAGAMFDGPRLMLTIACPTSSAQRPAGAIRVAQILAPAIADWVAAMPLVAVERAADKAVPVVVGRRRTDAPVILTAHPLADLDAGGPLPS